MSFVVYGVVPAGDGWQIDHQGHRVGRWSDRKDAEAEAARLVREARNLGHDAHLQAPVQPRSFRLAL